MSVTMLRRHTEVALTAAAYIRVSRKQQAEGHSPEIQREALKRLARQEGFVLPDDLIEEDHERGSSVTREGYQRIIDAVRAGVAHVVLVYMFDRWGRDGVEWLTRAREFDRLGVEIISVQEGKDEGGLMRFVRAGIAQLYSEQLAKRVRPACERGARAGIHQGPTPLGYVRVYPARRGDEKPKPGHLVVDAATAWIVQELFTRYDAGGWSLAKLARWLNSDERVPLAPRRDHWQADTINFILHNPTYIGRIRYNHKPSGYYDRAALDSAFEVEGHHEPLVSVELFESVQRKIAAAAIHRSYNRRGDTALGVGLLRCTCGGPMTHEGGRYRCNRRLAGRPCTTGGYLAAPAHAALAAEVRRLRGRPWLPQADKKLTGDESGQVANVQRALDGERERLRRHTRLMSFMDDDPTPEQIASFREVSAELSARIHALEEQIAALTTRAVMLPDLKRLHDRLTTIELGQVIDGLLANADEEALRALLQDLIVSARVVERRPLHRSRWLRIEVTWCEDVQLLLDVGLLWLDIVAV